MNICEILFGHLRSCELFHHDSQLGGNSDLEGLFDQIEVQEVFGLSGRASNAMELLHLVKVREHAVNL